MKYLEDINPRGVMVVTASDVKSIYGALQIRGVKEVWLTINGKLRLCIKPCERNIRGLMNFNEFSKSNYCSSKFGSESCSTAISKLYFPIGSFIPGWVRYMFEWGFLFDEGYVARMRTCYLTYRGKVFAKVTREFRIKS